MDHVALIRRLGGAKALSDALAARGVRAAPVTVRSWMLAGRVIPAKYWRDVAAIAAEAGAPVSYEGFAEIAARNRPTAEAA